MIKSFLNLCLILFLDMLAYMVAIFAAGAVFWSMVWAGLGKLNELARFFGFKRAKPR